MRFLTDTNAFLWFITDSPRLPGKAKALLESSDNERLLSIASIWEIAIKASLGKLTFRKPLEEFIPEQIALNGFTTLDISAAHALQTAHRVGAGQKRIAVGLTGSPSDGEGVAEGRVRGWRTFYRFMHGVGIRDSSPRFNPYWKIKTGRHGCRPVHETCRGLTASTSCPPRCGPPG